jgi:hypothetical protein
MVLSSYGDEVNVNWETRILESFNGDSEYVWKSNASKFSTKTDEVTFPQISYVNSWPASAFGSSPSTPVKSLGIHGRFDRREYNWIDVYPTKNDTPAEIPIPGRVRMLDMWVWGANYNYYVEIFLRDYQGVLYTLKLGDINHVGWKNLRVNIPAGIPQSKRTLPKFTGLTFVKFRIWTMPTERVDNFYVYFKQLKALTDVFESLYDGNELADPQRIQELWADANK